MKLSTIIIRFIKYKYEDNLHIQPCHLLRGGKLGNLISTMVILVSYRYKLCFIPIGYYKRMEQEHCNLFHIR